MIVQEVLIVNTEESSLKAEIYGWSNYDPSLMKPSKIRGLSGGHTPIGYTPDCVLRAMSQGWHLLGPPQPFEITLCRENNTDEEYQATHYEWWLVKEKEV